MEVAPPTRLVLFDLDGVLVFEDDQSTADTNPFLLLHENLPVLFARFPAAVGVVTHRPRREAQALLEAAGVDGRDLFVFYCAEDLLRVAVRRGRLFGLLRSGLRKSHAVYDIGRRWQIAAERICMIDDRPSVLADMHRHGVGLRLHVDQTQAAAAGDLVRFDAERAAAMVQQWAAQRGPTATITLPGTAVARAALPAVPLDVSPHRATWFEATRPLARQLRQTLRPTREMGNGARESRE